MPRERAWLVYDKWFKVYGDIVYFEVLGQGYLILGSSTRTSDLFEKRSGNYSDRVGMPMLIGLMGWDFNLVFMPYDPWWRRHRRTFHENFHAGMVHKYQPIQLRETHAFLRRLLVNPRNFMHHIRHAFAATIMDITYGIKVSGTDDPYISNAEEALQGISQAGIPGQFLVDLLPLLKYVPSWMPGANFKRKAAYWKKVNVDMLDKPFEHVKECIRQGTSSPSLVATYIEVSTVEGKYQAEEEAVIKGTAATAYAAGADTTVSAVQSFFLAMAMYPEIQRRGQAEIDSVVGPNRLPSFQDRQSLPYINAMVKETMRWQLVTPLGVGHMCSSDDEYDGYFIPKGTVVLGNIWSILHDPDMYPSPEEYMPERWLKDGQINPEVHDPTTAFGFGRRICPGRHLSDGSLYAMIALTLSVYNISPPMNDQGHPVHPQPEPTSGLLSYPVPFKCSIEPRSGAAEALINEEDSD
ncbi:cytochrome P450 [Collybia nuda]|uniref:Cytochrome P450 n=1 Tax=Collybia nuda TaxID=64659 RepID=A0A9P5XTS4_9AGAR|nr:cytochrome P450 [Collybia nuda]